METASAAALLTANPRSFPPEQYLAAFSRCLSSCYSSAIEDILLQSDASKQYALNVNAQDLIHQEPALAYLLLHDPQLVSPLLDEALMTVQQQMQTFMGTGTSAQTSVKANAHVRIECLPYTAGGDLWKPTISNLRNTDLGQMIRVRADRKYRLLLLVVLLYADEI